MQKLDPPGVGARDLKECLLLQLDAGDAAPRRAARAHPEPSGRHPAQPPAGHPAAHRLRPDRRSRKPSRCCKHLNPRPGRAVHRRTTFPTSCPTSLVERTEDGDYDVRLLDDWMPNIYISRRYIDLYRDKGGDPKAKEYLKRKIQAAQWLHGVDRAAPQHAGEGDAGDHPAPAGVPGQGAGAHRAAEDAADRRPGRRPRDDGEPGRRRQVGADAARHLPAEALLRRRHARRATGEEVAWETIKQKLLEIIDKEDKSNPLSDEDLVDKLQRGRLPRRPPHGDEVSQDARHPVVAAAEGLGGAEELSEPEAYSDR